MSQPGLTKNAQTIFIFARELIIQLAHKFHKFRKLHEKSEISDFGNYGK